MPDSLCQDFCANPQLKGLQHTLLVDIRSFAKHCAANPTTKRLLFATFDSDLEASPMVQALPRLPIQHGNFA